MDLCWYLAGCSSTVPDDGLVLVLSGVEHGLAGGQGGVAAPPPVAQVDEVARRDDAARGRRRHRVRDITVLVHLHQHLQQRNRRRVKHREQQGRVESQGSQGQRPKVERILDGQKLYTEGLKPPLYSMPYTRSQGVILTQNTCKK